MEEQVLTGQVDQVLSRVDVPDDGIADAVETGRRLLADTDDEW